MRVLITGGAGFIGSHLAETLVGKGHSVIILDDFSSGRRQNIEDLLARGQASLHEGSVTDSVLVARLAAAADAICHLGAVVGVRRVIEDPVRTLETNVLGTERVARAAALAGCPLLFASTSEVYGEGTGGPSAEDDPLSSGGSHGTRWSYACSKSVGESLTRSLVSEHSLPVVIARIFNTAGPRQLASSGMVLPCFAERALAGRPLIVHGDGEQTRSFCHVADTARALAGLLELLQGAGAPSAADCVFNVGGREEISIGALAELVRDRAGSGSEIHRLPYREVYGPGFEDIRHRLPDLRRLEGALGPRSPASLTTIVDDVLAEQSACLTV